MFLSLVHANCGLTVKRRHRQLTLQPNINDKELLVQATLQWHNSGVHSGLFTIGDIPESNTSCLTESRGGKKTRSYAVAGLKSQSKGQHSYRERLRTWAMDHTCTSPSPPLCSLSTIPHTYISPSSPSAHRNLLLFSFLPGTLIS